MLPNILKPHHYEFSFSLLLAMAGAGHLLVGDDPRIAYRELAAAGLLAICGLNHLICNRINSQPRRIEITTFSVFSIPATTPNTPDTTHNRRAPFNLRNSI